MKSLLLTIMLPFIVLSSAIQAAPIKKEKWTPTDGQIQAAFLGIPAIAFSMVTIAKNKSFNLEQAKDVAGMTISTVFAAILGTLAGAWFGELAEGDMIKTARFFGGTTYGLFLIGGIGHFTEKQYS